MRRSLASIATAVVWGLVPAIAIACVVAYFGTAVARGVYPPIVPVEGISMNPLLHVGDLVLLRHVDPNTLKKGDIIAFHTTAAAQRQYSVPGSYVHRIVQVSHFGGRIAFRTKGDNVTGADPFWTSGTSVIGEYSGHIPKVGYAFLFLRSRQAQILAAALILIALVYYAMGYFERRADERDQTVVEFASMVDEVRHLAHSMAGPVPPAPETTDEKLTELVGAVSEYGEHLRSHTAVVRNLAATTAALHSAADEMRSAVAGAWPAPAGRRRATAGFDQAAARARRSLDEFDGVLAVLRPSTDPPA